MNLGRETNFAAQGVEEAPTPRQTAQTRKGQELNTSQLKYS